MDRPTCVQRLSDGVFEVAHEAEWRLGPLIAGPEGRVSRMHILHNRPRRPAAALRPTGRIDTRARSGRLTIPSRRITLSPLS